MAQKPNDEARLQHMLTAAEKALHFSRGKTREEFEQDEVLCLALVRLFEILGEAAANVSQATRARHPDVPWIEIVGMRNRIIHAYDQIDLEVVWQTLSKDFPPLIDALKRILDSKNL